MHAGNRPAAIARRTVARESPNSAGKSFSLTNSAGVPIFNSRALLIARPLAALAWQPRQKRLLYRRNGGEPAPASLHRGDASSLSLTAKPAHANPKRSRDAIQRDKCFSFHTCY